MLCVPVRRSSQIEANYMSIESIPIIAATRDLMKIPVLRERVGVRAFLEEGVAVEPSSKSPSPCPLPEYDSTELVEVRERGE